MRAAADVEVVVVGGGVAGCSVAIGLAAAGVPVGVVEARETAAGGSPGRWRPGETLPPAAGPHLRALGVWDEFVAAGHLPVAGTRSAWGDGVPAERDFLFDPDGCGWHLDRLRFDAAMASAARRAGAQWLTGRPAAVARTTGGWALDVGHRTLRVPIVVDASGRASSLGRACGARRRVVDRLVALVVVARGAPAGPGEDPRVLVEAARGGWWYSAAVPGGDVVVAYMTDPDLLPANAGRGDRRAWSGLLDDAPLTAARVGPGMVSGPSSPSGPAGPGPEVAPAPRVVAAGSSVLVPPAGRGWLAVGDAAATHDPLSSQGITTALAHGRAAAATVVAALGGDQDAVRRYAGTVVTDYARYLSMRAGYYALERRWPGSPFWERRHRLVAPPAPAARAERHPPVPSPADGRP